MALVLFSPVMLGLNLTTMSPGPIVDSSGVIIHINDNTKYSIVSNCNDNRFGELTVMNVTYDDRGVLHLHCC